MCPSAYSYPLANCLIALIEPTRRIYWVLILDETRFAHISPGSFHFWNAFRSALATPDFPNIPTWHECDFSSLCITHYIEGLEYAVSFAR